MIAPTVGAWDAKRQRVETIRGYGVRHMPGIGVMPRAYRPGTGTTGTPQLARSRFRDGWLSCPEKQR